VHILALFDELESALKLQDLIYDNLPGENDQEAFGMQVVVNEKGEVLRFNQKLLIGASTLTVEEVVQAIHSLNGLAIASHIDREGFSITGQLGFIRLSPSSVSPTPITWKISEKALHLFTSRRVARRRSRKLYPTRMDGK
jgi:hypothetical protein